MCGERKFLSLMNSGRFSMGYATLRTHAPAADRGEDLLSVVFGNAVRIKMLKYAFSAQSIPVTGYRGLPKGIQPYWRMEKESKRSGLINGLRNKRREHRLGLSTVTYVVTPTPFQRINTTSNVWHDFLQLLSRVTVAVCLQMLVLDLRNTYIRAFQKY